MVLIKIIQLIWKSKMYSHTSNHNINKNVFMMSETLHTYHRATAYEHLAINQKYSLEKIHALNLQIDHYQRNAIWFFLHSALKGYSTAQYKLGMLYLHGHLGLDTNTLKAQKWLILAANQGHLDAQLQLSILQYQ